MISIKGKDKSAVLAALYNASRPMGMGHARFDPEPMTADEARDILSGSRCFDYLNGRVMKVDLSSDDEFDEFLYDRDNGSGAAQRAVDSVT